MGHKSKAKRMIICLLCMLIVLYAAACSKDTDAGSTENRFERPVSDVAEIEIIGYPAGEQQSALYSDSESLLSIYDILNTIVVGEQAALDPTPSETVEIVIKYSDGDQQSFTFNDGCILIDGKYYLLENESILVDSQYWPNK